jgi:hypothetical protein
MAHLSHKLIEQHLGPTKLQSMEDRLAPPPQQPPGKKKGPTYAKRGNIPPQRLSFPCQALFGEFSHNQDPELT